MKKGKLNKLIANINFNIQGFIKTKNKKNNGWISILQEHLSKKLFLKNTVLTEKSSKEAGKAFLVKIENKMLPQTTKILKM